MATLMNRSGVYTVQWVPASGGPHRRTLGLGRCRRTAAEAVRNHVAAIVNAQIHRAPLPPATAHWLNECGDKLHAKLVRKGLADPRTAAEAPAVALDAACDQYIRRRTDLKPGTRTILERTRASLVAFFTKGRGIDSISRAEAVDWQRHVRENLSPATAHLYGKKARQVFADAVDRRLIAENPFRKLKLGPGNNPERMAYVPAADVLAVIDATPDQEWKLLFAAARFAAARIPSEIREWKWTDVDLATGRMTLRSPKTEHHEGKASRVVPISGVLAGLLTDAIHNAEVGEVYILPRLRRTSNHTTTGVKLIERAGLTPWPRTMQNLRSSCETDWAVRFPLHVACAWAGNTPAIAQRHYLQITDDHWSAARSAAESTGIDRTTTEKPNAETPANADGSGFSMAPEEPQPLSNLPQIPGIPEKTLRRALHRLLIASPREHRSALSALASPLPRARAAGTGGQR